MKKTLVLMLCILSCANAAYAKFLNIRNQSDKKLTLIKQGRHTYVPPYRTIDMDLQVGDVVENWIGSDKMCEWVIPDNNVHYDVTGITYGLDGKQFGCTIDMRANDL